MNQEVISNLSPQYSNPFKQGYHQKSASKDETINRKRDQFHAQIRIKQSQRFRSQKRKQLQASLIVDQMLSGEDLPRQSREAFEWTKKLLEQLHQSKNYVVESFQLRSIFEITQKFPSSITLKLFAFVLDCSQNQYIQHLFDLDVMRVLHNVLKFPQVSDQQYQRQITQTQHCTLYQQQLHSKRIKQIRTIKLAIAIISKLYDRSLKIRNFSITTHQTFEAYIKPTSKMYRLQIKSEVVSFLKSAMKHMVDNYHNAYLDLIKYGKNFVFEYKITFEKFIQTKEWQSLQTLSEALYRCSILMGFLSNCLKQNKQWIIEFLNSTMMVEPFGFLTIIMTNLSMCQNLTESIIQGNLFNQRDNCQIFLKCLNLYRSTMSFYNHYVDKMTSDGVQDIRLVPAIIRNNIQMLDFLKIVKQHPSISVNTKETPTQYEQVTNEQIIDLRYLIEKLKNVLYFSLNHALDSQFDRYHNFAEQFINVNADLNQDCKYTQIHPQQRCINIFQLVFFWLKKEENQSNIYEVHSLMTTLIIMSVENYDQSPIPIIDQIIEHWYQTIKDNLVSKTSKQFAINSLVQIMNETNKNCMIQNILEQRFLAFKNSHANSLDIINFRDKGYIDIAQKLLSVGDTRFVENQIVFE